jgi:hypothetical protein
MVIPSWNLPPTPPPPLKPPRQAWREYLVSFLVVAALLVGAVALERFGLWPDSLKVQSLRSIGSR